MWIVVEFAFQTERSELVRDRILHARACELAVEPTDEAHLETVTLCEPCCA